MKPTFELGWDDVLARPIYKQVKKPEKRSPTSTKRGVRGSNSRDGSIIDMSRALAQSLQRILRSKSQWVSTMGMKGCLIAVPSYWSDRYQLEYQQWAVAEFGFRVEKGSNEGRFLKCSDEVGRKSLSNLQLMLSEDEGAKKSPKKRAKEAESTGYTANAVTPQGSTRKVARKSPKKRERDCNAKEAISTGHSTANGVTPWGSTKKKARKSTEKSERDRSARETVSTGHTTNTATPQSSARKKRRWLTGSANVSYGKKQSRTVFTLCTGASKKSVTRKTISPGNDSSSPDGLKTALFHHDIPCGEFAAHKTSAANKEDNCEVSEKLKEIESRTALCSHSRLAPNAKQNQSRMNISAKLREQIQAEMEYTNASIKRVTFDDIKGNEKVKGVLKNLPMCRDPKDYELYADLVDHPNNSAIVLTGPPGTVSKVSL